MPNRLILISIVAVGAVITLLRVPVSHIDTIWAEDGNTFLQQHIDGTAGLFSGYAGYQHLIPRIVTALLAWTVPIDAYGIAVFVACAILTGLVGAAVFWLSRDLVPWVPARLALAGVTFLLPLSGQEVVGNLADFHTYCLWLMPWLLLYRPRTWASGVGWGVVAFLCAMTEIQSIIFVPLLVLVLIDRHRKSWPIGIGLLLGLLGQIITTLLTPRPTGASWLGFPSLALGYLYNTVLPMLNPNPDWEAGVLVATGPLVPLLVALPFVAAIVLVLVRGTSRQRILVIALVLASGATYAGAAVLDGGGYFLYAHHTNAWGFEGLLGSRYGVVSGLFLAATVPVAAAVLWRIGESEGRRWPGVVGWVAIVGLLLTFAIASTQSVSSRESGVTWSGNVAAAREECATLGPTDIVDVADAPFRQVQVPCRLLVP
ncbi:hypothetical protein HDC94_000621 [Leifsonia sp. AK011]|uniref:hypothetical protein n=1 Tax=Leifsonia sp. AK011 TaxID=2723075 RepID=UPI0015C7334C|nr:hypothetical protein [Leifsonia sp. AK011]NYF09465.1 hypothetical protein [Leifsonia sp. AK011]